MVSHIAVQARAGLTGVLRSGDMLDWKEGRETDVTEAKTNDEENHGDRHPHLLPNEDSTVNSVLMNKVHSDTNKRFRSMRQNLSEKLFASVGQREAP